MESMQVSTDGLIREPFGPDQDFIFVLLTFGRRVSFFIEHGSLYKTFLSPTQTESWVGPRFVQKWPRSD